MMLKDGLGRTVVSGKNNFWAIDGDKLISVDEAVICDGLLRK